MTANGKVDRRALRVAADSRASNVDLTSEFVAPRNSTEQVLADIWGEILHLKDVGVHDNFFELGGHSLLATQLVSRVQALFQMALPLRQVFEKPTIATLAEAIRQTQEGGNRPSKSRKAGLSQRLRGACPCRCRLPRSGCGSCIGCLPARRPTTSRPVCACTAR